MANIYSILICKLFPFSILKLSRFTSWIQLKNKYEKSVTFLAIKLFTEFNDVHPSNILDIVVISSVGKSVKSILIIVLQSLNISAEFVIERLSQDNVILHSSKSQRNLR